jgi:hypothetical protein
MLREVILGRKKEFGDYFTFFPFCLSITCNFSRRVTSIEEVYLGKRGRVLTTRGLARTFPGEHEERVQVEGHRGSWSPALPQLPWCPQG